MKRAMLGIMLVAALLLPTNASARGAMYWFEKRHTYAHGWIVKAGNDSWTTTIRTRCHWWAGSYWHTSWVIEPGEWFWTTSDAGSWGDRRPVGLRCNYTVLY